LCTFPVEFPLDILIEFRRVPVFIVCSTSIQAVFKGYVYSDKEKEVTPRSEVSSDTMKGRVPVPMV
jgi:hypothetical protein